MELAQEQLEQGRGWWLEREVLWLLILVIGAYFIRLPTLALRGEETRRAQIAREMMRSGDWVVPRQQGVPFLSRPPLQNWLIALSVWLRGDFDEWSIRLPGAVAVLLTTLLIYGYGRSFVSRLGALAAAVGFATMTQVLILGRLAETESLFTLLLGGALLTWHWGWSRGWPAGWTWTAGYGLAALATLAKGPQPPVYFTGAVGLYLLVRRQWRSLLTPAHLLGLSVFALVVGAWLVPFWLEEGWGGVQAIAGGDVQLRFVDSDRQPLLRHLVSFPVEVLLCTAPWSFVLGAYLLRPLRAGLGAARPAVVFLAVCLAVAFPTCWLTPGAKGRYLMPLYPCLAVLAGVVLERMARAEPRSLLARLAAAYWAGCVALVAAGVALVGAGNWLEEHTGQRLGEPAPAIMLCVLAGLALAGLLVWGRRAGPRLAAVPVLALAAFLALGNTLAYVNIIGGHSNDPGPQIAHVRDLIPAGEQLVSFGVANERFAYHYQRPIALAPAPRTAADVAANVKYFCVCVVHDEQPQLPFAWKTVAVVACDRYLRPHFEDLVLIGQRIAP